MGLWVCVRGGVSWSFLVVSCCLCLLLAASGRKEVCLWSYYYLAGLASHCAHITVFLFSPMAPDASLHLYIRVRVRVRVLLLLAASASVCVFVVLFLLSSCSGVLPPLSNVLRLPCRVFRGRGHGRDLLLLYFILRFHGTSYSWGLLSWDFVFWGFVIIGTRYSWDFVFSKVGLALDLGLCRPTNRSVFRSIPDCGCTHSHFTLSSESMGVALVCSC